MLSSKGRTDDDHDGPFPVNVLGPIPDQNGIDCLSRSGGPWTSHCEVVNPPYPWVLRVTDDETAFFY